MPSSHDGAAALIDLTSDLSDEDSPSISPPSGRQRFGLDARVDTRTAFYPQSAQHIQPLSLPLTTYPSSSPGDFGCSQPLRIGQRPDKSESQSLSPADNDASASSSDSAPCQALPASRVVNRFKRRSPDGLSTQQGTQDSQQEGCPSSCPPEPVPQPATKKPRNNALSNEEKERRERAKQEKKEAVDQKKAQKQAEQACKAAEREQKKQEKLERDAHKERERVAKLQQKAASKEARGGLKDHAMTVQLSKNLVLSPVGRLLTEELEAAKPPYQVEIVDGTLSPLRTVTWTSSDSRGRQREAAAKGVASAQQPAEAAAAEDDETVVPYVLIHLQSAEFVAKLDGPRGAEGLVAQVAAEYPDRTLGLLLQGIEHYLTILERREHRQAASGSGPTFVRKVVDAAILDLTIKYPGVRYCHVVDDAEAADHMVFLTRALAKQPFTRQDGEWEGPGGNGASGGALLASHPLVPPQQAFFKALECIPSLASASRHAVASSYGSMGALIASFADPDRNEKETADGIATMMGTNSSRRVGPAGALKLLQLLTTLDPNAKFVQ